MLVHWQSLEERLFEQTCAIIEQFAAEHPDSLCSFFAYDIDQNAGYFLPSFDTPENALKQAQQNEQRAIERREKLLLQPWSWRTASITCKFPQITDYSPDIGYFAYHIYAEIDFPELAAFKESDMYPQPENEVDDDYIEGNIHIVLWKVIERLMAGKVFSQLRLSSPFRVGYQLHEKELLTLRILNWPQH